MLPWCMISFGEKHEKQKHDVPTFLHQWLLIRNLFCITIIVSFSKMNFFKKLHLNTQLQPFQDSGHHIHNRINRIIRMTH